MIQKGYEDEGNNKCTIKCDYSHIRQAAVDWIF